MRPGQWSELGFLGESERLSEVIARDDATLARLGLRHAQLADALDRLLDGAQRTIVAELERATARFMTDLRGSGQTGVPGPGADRPGASDRATATRGAAALWASIEPTAPFVPATSTRTFRVATGEVGELVVLPDALTELHREAPGVTLDFQPIDGSLRRRLEDGELDFVVGDKLPAFPGLMRKTICNEPVVVVLRRGHPAARRLTLQRYLELAHIAVTSGTIVDAALARPGATRRIGVRLTSLVVAMHLASRTDLALTTGLTFAAASSRDLPTELVRHPHIPLKIPILLSWHERSHHDPGAVWARAFADRVTRRAVEHGLRSVREPG